MIKMSIQIDGSDKFRAAMGQLSGAQARQAYVGALRDVGFKARGAIQAEMRSVFDRPTPFMLRSVGFHVDESKLSVRILPSYIDRQDPGDPQKALQAHAFGGQRAAKRYEVALRTMGILPPGWATVAGRDMPVDAYGNIPSRVIKAVLTQLRTTRAVDAAGRNRKLRSQIVRAAGQYIVIPPGGNIQPGIYHRELAGRGITPVLIFVTGTNYRKRLDLYRVAERANLQEQFERRVRKHIYDTVEGA